MEGSDRLGLISELSWLDSWLLVILRTDPLREHETESMFTNES